jgi:hypothetical protein
MSTGYLVKAGKEYIVQDTGSAVLDRTKIGRRGKQKGLLFSETASPASVCDATKLISENISLDELLGKGYRNSLTVLKRFDLISVDDELITLNSAAISKFGGFEEAIWTSAKNEPVIGVCMEHIKANPSISGADLGETISNQYQMDWTAGSSQRNGNSLRQWSQWVHDGISSSCIPEPPGRKKS